jgi:hypothetical protein
MRVKIMKNNKETITRIEQYIKDHNSRTVKTITFKENGSNKRIGQNGIHYIQLSLQRSKSLIEGYMANYENYPLLSILAARCHFENTGAVAYFFDNLQKYYKNEINYDEIDNLLRRLSLGCKVIPGKKNINQKCEPISVMNMIDKTDKLLKSMSPEMSVFRDFYNELSEFCHPNYFGMYFYCERTENMTFNYSTNKMNNKGNVFMQHLCISAGVFLMLYDNIYEVLKTKEEIPIISR